MNVIMMSHKRVWPATGPHDLEDGRISVLDAATLAGFGRPQRFTGCWRAIHPRS